uniref:Putative anion transporter 4, chloroplastic n=1 Tax=Lygus hesperus TaxID=30085 RepID=A0A0A9WUP5_LYGHE
MRLKKWLGVRHIQVVMYSVLLFLDIYLTETVKMYVDNTNKQIKGGKFSRITRAFSPADLVLIEQVLFAGFVLGRSIWPFFIMRFNNKYLILGIVLLEIICCGVFQQLVVLFELAAFAILVGMVYLLQSAHYSLAINIIAKWVPPNEYTRAVVVVAAGDTFARAIVGRSAVWSNNAVMSAIFQISVALKTIWCVIYMVVGAQDPQTSFLLGKAEWEFLSREIGPRKKVQCNMKIPWKSILTCPRLYAMDFLGNCQ